MSRNDETELSWLQGLSQHDDTNTTREDIEEARRVAGAAARAGARPSAPAHTETHDDDAAGHDGWLRSLGGTTTRTPDIGPEASTAEVKPPESGSVTPEPAQLGGSVVESPTAEPVVEVSTPSPASDVTVVADVPEAVEAPVPVDVPAADESVAVEPAVAESPAAEEVAVDLVTTAPEAAESAAVEFPAAESPAAEIVEAEAVAPVTADAVEADPVSDDRPDTDVVDTPPAEPEATAIVVAEEATAEQTLPEDTVDGPTAESVVEADEADVELSAAGAPVAPALFDDLATTGPAEADQVEAEQGPAEETPKKRSRWRKPALIASAATVLVLGAGGGVALALTKDITVQADGQTVSVSTFAGDVAGALAAAQISLGQYDEVTPALTAPISDDDTIVVDRARLVTVSLDGALHETWTTADTLDQALTELGVEAGAGEQLELSADRAAAIPDTGLAVDAVITFPVTVTDGASAAAALRTDVDTVGELLTAQKIDLGEHDVVTPGLQTTLTPGTTVKIDRVQVTSVTEPAEVAQPADQSVEDPALNQGLTEIAEPGNPGVEAVTFQVTTVDGTETERVETARELQVAPKATVVRVGTRLPDPSEKYADPANWSVNWDGIARCESTNNWAINTGNGYYGGLQFDRRTWLGAGGGAYGDTANLATKEQQIYIAEKVYASRGLQPWACGHAG